MPVDQQLEYQFSIYSTGSPFEYEIFVFSMCAALDRGRRSARERCGQGGNRPLGSKMDSISGGKMAAQHKGGTAREWLRFVKNQAAT